MGAAELSVPARYFALLIDHLEANGTPCRDALSAAQVRLLNDPQAMLSTSAVDVLIAETRRLSGRDDLGFELGRLIRLNSHDVLGYAILSCQTVDRILRLVARYYRLMTPMFTLRYVRNGAHAELLFAPAVDMPQATLLFYLEMLVVSFHVQIMAVTLGRQAPYTMHVSMAEPAHVKRYRDLAPASVHFDAGPQFGVSVRIGTQLFDEPLPMTDARALHQAEARCKLLMQQFSENGKWRDWVSMMLREADDSQPTLEELAGILNMSVRTLNRHLDREGASFRQLALAIRNERACHMLAGGNYSVAQIAARLGYSDIGNFSRSFKRYNGINPSAFAARGDAAPP